MRICGVIKITILLFLSILVIEIYISTRIFDNERIVQNIQHNCSSQASNDIAYSFPESSIFDFFPHLKSVNLAELKPIMLSPTVRKRKKVKKISRHSSTVPMCIYNGGANTLGKEQEAQSSQSSNLMTPFTIVIANYFTKVFCIPVVARKTIYINRTLRSLFRNLESSVRDEVLFVVMLAFPNTSTPDFKTLSFSLVNGFSHVIEEGLLEIAAIPPNWYKGKMESIPSSFGDSNQRMYWRTKQNLDYFYLMSYGKHKADYYMQLEDDIIATPKYCRTILNYIKLKEGRPWLSMHFSTLGFIGKLFRSKDVIYITNAIAAYYKIKPVDWIFDNVEYSIACSPEHDYKLCDDAKKNTRVMIGPPQFQHIGTVSSLYGKRQRLKEKLFNDASNKTRRNNPSAILETSMPTYGPHTLPMGYKKFAFMWFTKVQKGDNITIKFILPEKITGIQMISGIAPAPFDTFAPDTKIYAVDMNHKELLLGSFSSYGDLVIRQNRTEITQLILRVFSDHPRWVIVGHVVIDVDY